MIAEESHQRPGFDAATHSAAPPGRRHPLRLTWPLVLMTPALLVLVTLGLTVQGLGHILTGNGARWERSQQNAVKHIARFSQTCASADHEAFLADMTVLQNFAAARGALFAPTPDPERALGLYRRIGLAERDARLLVMTLPRLQGLPAQRKTTAIWLQANAVAQDIARHGAQLVAATGPTCAATPERSASLQAIYAADERLAPLREQFDEVTSRARWILGLLVLGCMVLLALPMTAVSFLLTARLQRRAAADAEALALSERRLQLAFKGSGHGVWELELGGGAVSCSGATMALLGHRPLAGTMSREAFVARVHPDDRLAFAQALSARSADWQRLEVELQMRHQDGSYRWLRLAGQNVPSLPGQPPRMLGTAADVTERRQRQQADEAELQLRRRALQDLRSALARMTPPAPAAAEAAANRTLDGIQAEIRATTQAVAQAGAQLRELNERLQAVFALSPDAFVSFDEQQRISMATRATEALTGLRAEALHGQHASAFFSALERLAAPGGRPLSLQSLLQPHDADDFTVELSRPSARTLSLELREGSHPKVRYVLCLRDLTQQRAVERLKTEFITAAAHELRTPMTVIYGYVEMMMHRPLDEARRKALHATVHRQCQRMVDIVNDLADLGRLEARQQQALTMRELELGALLQRATQELPVPEGRDPPRQVDAETWPAACLSGDEAALLRALRSVLDNAYKFSPAGGEVSAVLTRRSTPTGDDEACIRIADCGIGMSPEQLDRVGERFYRADSSGHLPGTGLGMSIVQQVVKLHGGHLRLHSQPGQGTQVEICLPVQPLAGR